jgi:hypothetical protein
MDMRKIRCEERGNQVSFLFSRKNVVKRTNEEGTFIEEEEEEEEIEKDNFIFFPKSSLYYFSISVLL